jgi:predicted secreted protein with PEFG-CTERM motif
MIASIGLAPAFGQVVNPISVTTDKTSYEDGDRVLVAGEVKDLLSGTPISLIVTAPNGNRVILDQLDVGLDKKYSTEFTVGGPLMRSGGTYTIEVTYGSQTRTAETTFSFAGSLDGGLKETKMAVAGTEFMVSYKITGGKLISITPDVEANSLIIAITAFQDGSLVITLPRALIDAKMGDQDDTFFVLVDGEEVDFEETTTSTDRTLTILFPAGAEEIEIIGTKVVPEFGTIAVMILAVAIISIIAVSAKSKLSIMPRY